MQKFVIVGSEVEFVACWHASALLCVLVLYKTLSMKTLGKGK